MSSEHPADGGGHATGIFAKPMRPVTFWGMWLLLAPSGLLIACSVVEMLRAPFSLKAVIPIVMLSASVCVFAGALARVTRHYLMSRKSADDDGEREPR